MSNNNTDKNDKDDTEKTVVGGFLAGLGFVAAAAAAGYLLFKGLTSNETVAWSEGKLDLHGKSVKQARDATVTFIEDQQRTKENSTAIIITGYGKHSSDKNPKIKPAIKDLLDEMNINSIEMDGGGGYRIAIK